MSVPPPVSIPAPRHAADDCPSVLGTVPPAPPAGALSKLIRARTSLHDAERARQPSDRYIAAYLAAVRAATAVLATRAPDHGDAPPASVWRLLNDAAPEFRDWAEFFAAHSERRASAQAGIAAVSDADAAELLVRAGEFADAVGRSLSGAPR